jgi:hypothetical protein
MKIIIVLSFQITFIYQRLCYNLGSQVDALLKNSKTLKFIKIRTVGFNKIILSFSCYITNIGITI